MVKELWYEIKHPGDYRVISEQYGVSPAMARLLVNRILSADHLSGDPLPSADQVREYLSPDISCIYSYEGIPDIDKAVDILCSVIDENKKLRVIGDYDIDGVCSTYILASALSKAGALVDHSIPHRITDGYGLNDRLIKEASGSGIDCVITCDNGISAAAQVKLAHELGMKVIVTDHHEVPYHMEGEDRIEDLPEADAVVDIKRSESTYGFSELCGAVVAFKVIAALYERLGIPREETEEYIELAAFATIGDVMPLKGENRAIVAAGLKRLSHTSNPGMQALIRAQGIENTEIKPYHVGFILGPCINATGRLATADNAFELLAAKTPSEAERIAGMLVAMNNDRKAMTDKGLKKAAEIAGSADFVKDKVLVVYLPDTHESVAGIIAGKLREQTGKPAFVLTDGENVIKGSGRSIEEYDMHKAMTDTAELYDKFGGHKMAGGLSLKEGVTPEMMRERLNSICTLSEDDLAIKIHFDMQLPVSYADMALVSDMMRLEPFGVGNPRPLFAAKDVTLRNINIYGGAGNVLKCLAEDRYGSTCSAVYFGDAGALSAYAKSQGKIKILYYPEINEYKGNRTLQLRINNYC